jgi:hypothetical protein
VLGSLNGRISFENGYIDKPILGEVRLSSSLIERFSDRVLDKKLERVEAELEECRRNRRVSHNPSNPNRAGLKLVKGGGRVQGRG